MDQVSLNLTCIKIFLNRWLKALRSSFPDALLTANRKKKSAFLQLSRVCLVHSAWGILGKKVFSEDNAC